PAKQRFGVAITSDPAGDLGEHADRGDVGRMRFQTTAERRFCMRYLVGSKRSAGGEQLRVRCGESQRFMVRAVATFDVAFKVKMIAERTPAVGKFRCCLGEPPQ